MRGKRKYQPLWEKIKENSFLPSPNNRTEIEVMGDSRVVQRVIRATQKEKYLDSKYHEVFTGMLYCRIRKSANENLRTIVTFELQQMRNDVLEETYGGR